MLRFAVIVFVAACSGHPAPPPAKPVAPPPVAPLPAAAPDPEAPLIPFDDAQTRVLPNGITVMIADIPELANQHAATAMLAIRAGSLDETDAQTGAAHALVHLVAPLLGDEAPAADDFGRTSFDATTYAFDMDEDAPTEGDEAGAADRIALDLDRKLGLLRKVVDGKLRPDAFRALRDAIHTMEYDDSGTERDPTDWATTRRATHPDEEEHNSPATHFANLTPAAVDEFRRTYYRTDRIAVIVVAHVDTARVFRAIEKRFGTLPRPTAPAPVRLPVTAPPHPDPVIATNATDREHHARIALRVPHREERGERGQRGILVDEVLARAVADRVRISNPMTVPAEIDRVPFTDDEDLLRISTNAYEPVELVRFATELARLRTHGLDAAALETALATIVVDRAAAANGGDPDLDASYDGNTNEHAAALAAHFVRGTPMMYAQTSHAAIARISRAITPAEVDAAAAAELAPSHRTIELPGDMFDATERAALPAKLAAADAATVEPWPQRPGAQPLMTPPAVPAKAIVATQAGLHDLVVWTLANGARVIVQTVKPTSMHPTSGDVVGPAGYATLVATGAGGWARLPVVAALDARFVGDLVLKGGLGDRSAEAVRAVAAERQVNLFADIRPTNHEVRTTGKTAQLETMFQMMHLALARPAVDRATFDTWRAERAAAIEKSSRQVYLEAIDAVRTVGGNTPLPLLTKDMLAKIELDPALAEYANAVGDVKHTTFLLTGTMTADEARPLVETYLATLADRGTRAVRAGARAKAPAPPQPIVYVPPDSPRSLQVAYVAPSSGDPVIDKHDVWMLAWALQDRFDRLPNRRFTVYVSGAVSEDNHLTVTLTANHVPQAATRADFTLVEGVVAALAKDGPDATTLATLGRRLAPQPLMSATWAQAMLEGVWAGRDPVKHAAELADHATTTARLKPELVKALAKKLGKPRVEIAFEPVTK